MSVPTSEVGYTSATTGRGVHEDHKVHVVALVKKELFPVIYPEIATRVSFRLLIYSLKFIELIDQPKE
jgi:hypothetical protein